MLRRPVELAPRKRTFRCAARNPTELCNQLRQIVDPNLAQSAKSDQQKLVEQFGAREAFRVGMEGDWEVERLNSHILPSRE